MQNDLVQPSLKRSWAYQYRLPITAVVLVGTWTVAAATRPWIAEGDASANYFRIAGWIVYASGMIMRLWATLWIAGRKKQTLVTDGPYRMCRNPLYLGTFLMGLGLVLILRDPVFAAGLAILVGLYALFVVPAEEHYMRSRFPEAHDQYRAQVPRWIPSIRQLRRDEVFRSVVDRGALYRECLRMVWWMLLPILAELTVRFRPLVETRS